MFGIFLALSGSVRNCALKIGIVWVILGCTVILDVGYAFDSTCWWNPHIGNAWTEFGHCAENKRDSQTSKIQ